MSRFYTPAMQAWLGGYQPRAADELMTAKQRSAALDRVTEDNRRRRMAGEPLQGWGTGSIVGLSAAGDAAIKTHEAHKARAKR